MRSCNSAFCSPTQIYSACLAVSPHFGNTEPEGSIKPPPGQTQRRRRRKSLGQRPCQKVSQERELPRRKENSNDCRERSDGVRRETVSNHRRRPGHRREGRNNNWQRRKTAEETARRTLARRDVARETQSGSHRPEPE